MFSYDHEPDDWKSFHVPSNLHICTKSERHNYNHTYRAVSYPIWQCHVFLLFPQRCVTLRWYNCYAEFQEFQLGPFGHVILESIRRAICRCTSLVRKQHHKSSAKLPTRLRHMLSWMSCCIAKVWLKLLPSWEIRRISLWSRYDCLCSWYDLCLIELRRPALITLWLHRMASAICWLLSVCCRKYMLTFGYAAVLRCSRWGYGGCVLASWITLSQYSSRKSAQLYEILFRFVQQQYFFLRTNNVFL